MGDIGISQEQYAGSYPIIEPDPTVSIYFPRTDTEWSIGPAISIQRYHEQHPGPMAESLVEYIATRVVEEPKKFEPRTPRRGRKRIGMLPGGQPAEIPLELEPVCDYPAIATLRIWHEIPKYFDSRRGHMANALLETLSCGALGPLALAELVNIKRLTLLGSNCTTTLIDYFIARQDKDEDVAGGYKLYLLEKLLPGSPLTNFNEMSIEEQGKVVCAFEKCHEEFKSLGFRHPFAQWCHDSVWDPWQGRCYITNLEHAWYLPTDSRLNFSPQWTPGEGPSDVLGHETVVDPMMLTLGPGCVQTFYQS